MGGLCAAMTAAVEPITRTKQAEVSDRMVFSLSVDRRRWRGRDEGTGHGLRPGSVHLGTFGLLVAVVSTDLTDRAFGAFVGALVATGGVCLLASFYALRDWRKARARVREIRRHDPTLGDTLAR